MAVIDGDVGFRGVGHPDAPYGIESVAHCDPRWVMYFPMGSVGPTHGPIPEVNCSCGFYALSDRPDFPNGTATLEVELYGRVIRHEYGYRAEKQRVLAVRVDAICSSVLCDQRAVLVGVPDETTGTIQPFCRDHADLLPHNASHTPADLSALAGLLGTEVRWADNPAEVLS